MPAASAFGPMETRVRPTSRGRARCVSFRMGRRWEQTADGPRAGAVRLRRGYTGDRAVGAAVPPDRAVGSLLTRVRPTSRGRARCVSFRRGAAVGSDGERPTSRGRSPAARWATLPCPAGQGTLPGCGGDAVCPAGKGAAEWRAGSLAYHGGKQGIKAFSPSGEFTGAPGSGAVARCPAKDGDACPPANGTRPSPSNPFRIILLRQARRFTGTSHCHRFFAANIRRMHPTPASLARKIPTFCPSRPRLLPQSLPQGERRALPAPAQGSRPLRIPFGGTGVRFPASPVPQNAAGGRPLLVGRPPCMRSAAEQETKRSAQAPCSWGLGA